MDSLNRIRPTTSNRTNNSPSNDNLNQEKKLFGLPTEIENQIVGYLSNKDLINFSIAERRDLDAWHKVLDDNINEEHIVATMMQDHLPEPKIINRLIPCIPMHNSNNVAYKLPIEIVLNNLGILHSEKNWDNEAIFELADKLIMAGAKVPLVKFDNPDNEFNNAVLLIKEGAQTDLYLHLKRNPQILSMKDAEGNSLLHLALPLFYGAKVLPIICREKEVDYSLRNLAGDTPLSHVAKNWLNYPTTLDNFNMVLEHSLNKFDLEGLNNRGFNVLHVMSNHDFNNEGRLRECHWNSCLLRIDYKIIYEKFVTTLSGTGFNLNSLSREGYTPLKYAVDNYNIPLVLALLDNGAKFANETEKTAALKVIARKQSEIIDPNDECKLYKKPTLQVLNDVITRIKNKPACILQ